MSLQSAIVNWVFAQEWSNESVESIWSTLERHVQRGWATCQHCVSRSGVPLLSIAYKEAHQYRTQELPIGARSLLLTQDTHEIVLRGLNKFPDYSELDHSCLLAELSAACAGSSTPNVHCFLQRKAAGFVVHIFSLDGVNLEVMSKHALDGRHACEARRVLNEMFAPKDLGALAHQLYVDEVVVSGECISPEWDRSHPVLEGGEPRIEFFSVGPRKARPEVMWPSSAAYSWCMSRGLAFVSCDQFSAAEVNRHIESAIDMVHKWSTESEGYVLLVEVPCHVMELAPSSLSSVHKHASLVVPLRFKLKTIRYRLLRCLRSHILGEHILTSQHPFYNHPYVTLFMRWVREMREPPISAPELVERIKHEGIWVWSKAFEAAWLHLANRKRLRDEEMFTVSLDPLAELLAVVERADRLHYNSPHSVVMMCGVPGSGKSSAVKYIVSHLQGFRSVVHISRDAVAVEVTRAMCAASAGGAPSNHQLRRLKKSVHDAYCSRIADVARWLTFHSEVPVLVVLDACHASRAARKTFRELLPNKLCQCLCVWMSLDPICAIRRVASRSNHEVLEAVDAEKAVLDVSRVFEAPALDEPFTAVVEVDAARLSLAECAGQILHALKGDRHGCAPTLMGDGPTIEVVTVQGTTTDFSKILPICTSIIGPSTWAEGLPCAVPTNLPASVCLVPIDDSSMLRSTLWFLVARLIAHTSVSSVAHDSGAPSLVSRLTSWWRHRPSSTIDAAVELGHLRWIPGMFLSPNRTDPVQHDELDALARALRSRYETDLAVEEHALHITVQFEKGRDAASRAEFHRGLIQKKCGDVFEATVTKVLLDPRGACLVVDVSPLLPIGAPQLLHITLGHTHHVKAAYSLDMMREFSSRAAADDKRLHNFCQIAISNESQVRMTMQLRVVLHRS